MGLRHGHNSLLIIIRPAGQYIDGAIMGYPYMIGKAPIMVGGKRSVVESARRLLSVFGPVEHMGESPAAPAALEARGVSKQCVMLMWRGVFIAIINGSGRVAPIVGTVADSTFCVHGRLLLLLAVYRPPLA